MPAGRGRRATTPRPDCREPERCCAGRPEREEPRGRREPERRQATVARAGTPTRRDAETRTAGNRKAAVPGGQSAKSREAAESRNADRPQWPGPERRQPAAPRTRTPTRLSPRTERRQAAAARAGEPTRRNGAASGRSAAPEVLELPVEPEHRRAGRPGERNAGLRADRPESVRRRAHRAGSGVVVAVGFQVAAEAVEGPAAGRADAADRDAQLGGYFGVRGGWVLHQEFHQAPLEGR